MRQTFSLHFTVVDGTLYFLLLFFTDLKIENFGIYFGFQ